MTSKLRLILFCLALAASLLVAPAQGLAARAKAQVYRQALRESWFANAHWFARKQRAETRAQARPLLGVRAVRYARRLVGIPYSWGGSSPRSGFDCSGFVRFVYQHFGVELPHSSYADFNVGRRVTRGALRPGDLVFFDGRGHVGMYVGNGRFIHAPHNGTRVQISPLTGWYAGRYDGARRLTPA